MEDGLDYFAWTNVNLYVFQCSFYGIISDCLYKFSFVLFLNCYSFSFSSISLLYLSHVFVFVIHFKVSKCLPFFHFSFISFTTSFMFSDHHVSVLFCYCFSYFTSLPLAAPLIVDSLSLSSMVLYLQYIFFLFKFKVSNFFFCHYSSLVSFLHLVVFHQFHFQRVVTNFSIWSSSYLYILQSSPQYIFFLFKFIIPNFRLRHCFSLTIIFHLVVFHQFHFQRVVTNSYFWSSSNLSILHSSPQYFFLCFFLFKFVVPIFFLRHCFSFVISLHLVVYHQFHFQWIITHSYLWSPSYTFTLFHNTFSLSFPL